MPQFSRLTLLLIIFGLATTAIAADAVPQDTARKKSDDTTIKVNPASKARIEFVSDTWDFGSIPRGAIVIHSFIIKNVGKDTLIVSNVRTSCGCTTAPLSDSLIAPGGQASLTATFNSKKFNGKVTKQVFVDSNDPIKPYLKVSFTAVINDPLQTLIASPAEADFDSIKIDNPSQLKIKITNNDTKNANLSIVEQSAPSIVKASLAKPALAPGESTELTLDLQPQAKPGTLAQSLTLEANNIDNSKFTIPWKAVIK